MSGGNHLDPGWRSCYAVLLLGSPCIVFFSRYFFRIGFVFRYNPMLTVTGSSLIMISAVLLAHLPSPTSLCPPEAAPLPLTHMHIHMCALWGSHQAQLFAMLTQMKESGRKNVEASKAAVFKLERQRTTGQRKRTDKQK